MYVHRKAWEDVHGPIPAGMIVLHTCDNQSCVLVKHLRVGTYADNTADMISKGRGSRPTLRGSDHPHAKLTELDVVAIREAIASGEVQTRIAERFGVSSTAITGIKLGKTWTHVVQCSADTDPDTPEN